MGYSVSLVCNIFCCWTEYSSWVCTPKMTLVPSLSGAACFRAPCLPLAAPRPLPFGATTELEATRANAWSEQVQTPSHHLEYEQLIIKCAGKSIPSPPGCLISVVRGLYSLLNFHHQSRTVTAGLSSAALVGVFKFRNRMANTWRWTVLKLKAPCELEAFCLCAYATILLNEASGMELNQPREHGMRRTPCLV